MSVKLIIQGLRRSGTTIFWQTFRQDPRLICYDEPVNQYLYTLPERGVLMHPEEFAQLVEREGWKFWEKAPGAARLVVHEARTNGDVDAR